MRFLELRLHGVSGTSPEALLGVKKVADPIAGDKFVRFVRPESAEAGALPDSTGRRTGQLEGMSWGRLTSGSVLQATWLLLLPFAILNLAYWARSWDEENRAAALYRWFVRIIGLALTATIIFAVSSAALDQLAWQCGIQQGEACRAVHSWMAPTKTWSPGTLLVVATAAPLFVTLLLTFLSHRATLRYEAFPTRPHAGSTPTTGAASGKRDLSDPDLFDDRMWRGDEMVSRLRALHTATGVAVTALSLAIAVSGLHSANRPFARLAIALAGLTLAAAVALATPSTGLRWADDDSRMAGTTRRVLLGLATAALLAALIGALPVSGPVPARYAHLRGIIAAGHALTVLMIVLVAAIAVVTAVALASARRRSRADATTSRVPPTYGGYLGTLLAGFGAIAGFAYSAAVAFRVADWLSGEAQTDPCHCTTFTVTTTYVPALAIGAAAAAIYALVVVIVAVALFVRSRGRRRWQAYIDDVRADYAKLPQPERDQDNRIQRAVRARAYADMVSIKRLADLVMIAMVIAIIASVYALWGALNQTESWGVKNLRPPPSPLQTVVAHVGTIGSWIVLGFAAGLIALGALAWRSEAARRIVGILWDVMSFWPRAAQPFAPPCYSERAVPQLMSRLRYLVTARPDGLQGVVLAGHSQGSILSAAALAQLHDLEDAHAKHIGLLTFGCPLERLYAPAFPRVFGPSKLERLLVRHDPPRWINLWRPTDPIGGTLRSVLPERPLAEVAGGFGDEELLDPTELDMVEAMSAYAPIGGHLGYYSDPLYGAARSELVDRISEVVPDTPPPEDPVG